MIAAMQGNTARQRGNRTYDKPALSTAALVDLLHARGLDMPDRERAERYIKRIGYFRMSPYTIPFHVQPRTPEHRFRRGVAFDDILSLYVFDRALRLLVMDALERVEVAIRSAVTDHMSTTYLDPHWYTKSQNFSDARKHERLLKIVADQVGVKLAATAERDDDRAREQVDHPSGSEPRVVYRSALEHYLMTYGAPELPPSWLMVEMLTIGQLENAFQNVAVKRDRDAIAKSLGLNRPILDSWFRTYVRVRNICAHHGRLWNVGVGVYPKIPTSKAIAWPRADGAVVQASQQRLYPVLVSLQSVLTVISPRSSWAKRLSELLSVRSDIELKGMGIPAGWRSDPFWAQHLDAATSPEPT